MVVVRSEQLEIVVVNRQALVSSAAAPPEGTPRVR
jgi:hypothetical protein